MPMKSLNLGEFAAMRYERSNATQVVPVRRLLKVTGPTGKRRA
jgi:hypothetical protein